MTQMLRQQIDITKQQPVQVKRLAKARCDSEAEIIRPAIEREVLLTASLPTVTDRAALEEFLQFGSSRRATGDATGRTWTRDELYDERLSHYERADSSPLIVSGIQGVTVMGVKQAESQPVASEL